MTIAVLATLQHRNHAEEARTSAATMFSLNEREGDAVGNRHQRRARHAVGQ
jgi:hypothetical protein